MMTKRRSPLKSDHSALVFLRWHRHFWRVQLSLTVCTPMALAVPDFDRPRAPSVQPSHVATIANVTASPHNPGDPVDELLQRIRAGDWAIGEAVLLSLQDQIAALARQVRRGQHASFTLQTGDIVSAAFMKLMAARPDLVDGKHLMAYLATAMRSVLMEYHRQRSRRRNAENQLLESRLAEIETSMRQSLPDGDELLERLRRVNKLHAEILTLQCYAGLSAGSIASTLRISESAVLRAARAARAWLRREMERCNDD